MPRLRSGQSLHGAEVGFGKDRGIKWKEHIYQEHNFKEMLLYIIYLLNLPQSKCTAMEARLKEKAANYDVDFFDELRIDRKLNRLAATDIFREYPG